MGSESIEASTVSKSSGRFFPPGFRFHPTDEELVLYYLKRKICGRSLKLDIIGDVDVYKWDPEELPGQSKWKTGDRQWFFFSPRDRKYPNGGRSNRATMHGYWKATGKDRIITCNSRSVGIKKTLVYYEGRAPSGKRTDWVMHEYTLDEEELKRCRYVKEYYALYKVFKKSGPGPKNGEQYGAPFVEEEWVDDSCLDVDAFLVHNVKQPHPICVENAVIMHGDGPRLDITNNVVGEPQLVPSLAQITPVLDEEGSRKVDLGDDRIVMDSSYEPFGLQPGSELTRPAQEALLQPRSELTRPAQAASEVTLVTNNPVLEPQPLVINKDFLEMDDLIGPQPTVQNSETLVMEDLQLSDFDGFYAFDLYNDSTGFGEIGQFESQQIQQPHYVNNIEYAVTAENEIGYDLWAHDQRNDNLTATEAIGSKVVDAGFDLWTSDQRNDGSMAVSTHSSGVVVDENPGNSDTTRVNNRHPPETKEDDGSDSWFSSALWAFVESIPTTPASAAESSACVQRAFERMSSFSRGKNGNGDGNNADSGVGPARVRRSSRGIICFSFLGVLFAILCACLGTTSMEVLGPCKKLESFVVAFLGLLL